MDFYELRPYQNKLIEKIISKNNNYIVVLPQGLGKTIIAIEAIKRGNYNKILILVPLKTLLISWKKRTKEWNLPLMEITSENSTYSNWKSKNQKIVEMERKHLKIKFDECKCILTTPIFFTNKIYEGVININAFDLIIIDEGGETQKSTYYGHELKKSFTFLKNFKNKIICLMPPIMENLRFQSIKESLNAKVITSRFEDIKNYLTKTSTKKFFIEDPFVPRIMKMLEKKVQQTQYTLQGMLKEVGIIVNKKGILHLKKEQIDKCKNPEMAQKAYYGMFKYLHLKKLIYCGDKNELKNHVLYKHPEAKEWIDAENKRLEQLKQLIKRRVEKNPEFRALIFVPYIKMVELMIKELNNLGLNSAEIIGKTPNEIREEIVKSSEAGIIKILVCTNNVINAGVDLPWVNAVIHYDTNLNPYNHLQKTERIRGGEEIFIAYKDSPEVEKIETLIKNINEAKKEFENLDKNNNAYDEVL